MKRVLMVVMVVATLSSCTKSSSTNNQPSGYCPVTTGTTWTYLRNSSDSAYMDSVYTFTMTDSVVTLGTRSFHAAHSSAGSDVYYGITDSGYYRSGSLLAGLGIPQFDSFQELYFKGTASSDTAWTNSLPFTVTESGITIPLTATLTYSLTGTGLTKTINTDVSSNTFTDIASVHMNITTYIPGDTTEAQLGYGDFYYSKANGFVGSEVTTTVPGSPTVYTTFYIKSFLIK